MIKQKKPYEDEICDTCKFSHIDDSNPMNRDYKGDPILLSCDLQKPKQVRGSRACHKWKKY